MTIHVAPAQKEIVVMAGRRSFVALCVTTMMTNQIVQIVTQWIYERGMIMINRTEEFTDVELWLIKTMVTQMDNLVRRLDENPVWIDVCNEWYELKEKMGWEDIE